MAAALRVTSLLILMILASARAEGSNNCQERDFREKMGEARDQGESGWCFANTTADVASCLVGFRVSSDDIAITYHANARDKVKEDPDLKPILARSESMRGLIDEPPTVQDPEIKPLKYKSTPDSVTYHGIENEGGDEDVAMVLAAHRGFCPESEMPSGEDRNVKIINAVKAIHNRGKPSMSVAEAYIQWSDKQCPGRRKPQALLVPKSTRIAYDLDGIAKMPKDEVQKKRAELIQEIDHQLDEYRPVMAGINVNELTTKEWAAGQREHSVVIGGRKMINGQCHYFIRNSSGQDCDVFRPELRAGGKCDERHGGVWMTLDKLPSLYSIVTVKPQSYANRSDGGAPAAGKPAATDR